MTLREKMIKTAEQKCKNYVGGYICTDGEWCSTNTPEEFKAFIEKCGFEVLNCKSTENSTAIAITRDGYKFVWNGWCERIDTMNEG